MTDVALLATNSPVVRVNGTTVADLARDAIRVEIEDAIGAIRSLRLHLHPLFPREGSGTSAVEYLDGTPLDFGASIDVTLGPNGDQQRLFEGSISALQVSYEDGDTPHVSVYAEDALLKLRVTTRSRTYKRGTDADAIRAVVQAHGLTARVDASGPTYDVIQQIATDDLSFVQSRAARLGAEVWCNGKEVHVATRDQINGPAITLTQGSNLLAVTARADLADQRHGATLSGFDAKGRRSIEATGAISLVQAEITGGRTGPQLFGSAYGEQPARHTNRVPIASDQADAWVKAATLRRARRFVRVTGTTAGTPTLVVGARITLKDVGKPFDGGGYFVTRTLHTYDLHHGHRTSFDAERPNVSA